MNGMHISPLHLPLFLYNYLSVIDLLIKKGESNKNSRGHKHPALVG